MKLLSVTNARAMWIFSLADLNPRGKASENSALLDLGKRYSFVTSPSAADVITAKEKNEPIRYLGGTFAPPQRDPIRVDLLIYRNGVVADSRSSTADSELFLEDMFGLDSKEFGLLPHEGVSMRK